MEVLYCVAVGLILAVGTATSSSSARPNIVFIMADDLGWNDVGFHGSEIRTPYIDELAYNGVILNNYYVSPVCTPTRGSLMTGRHPIHLGLQDYSIRSPEPWGLPLNHTTMAQRFKGLGFDTHMVGKWHLGFFRSEYLPTNRGFDSHFGYWTDREDYFNHVGTEGYTGLDFRDNLTVVNETAYSTELYTTRAEKIIMEHDTARPLFLYLAHQAVHTGNDNHPLQAPQKYIDRFPDIKNLKRRTFAGMVSALDDSVGAVVTALERRDMLDNTVIVFSTDNGGPAHDYYGNAACNFPLRGIKDTLWEGGVHGVGFVSSKLLEKPGTISNNMVHVSDWLPTLYSAAGGAYSDLGPIDGLDLWEMIKTDGSPVRTEILHNIDPVKKRYAFRDGDYKIIGGAQSENGRYDGWYHCTPTDEQSTIGNINPYLYSLAVDVEIGVQFKMSKREASAANPPIRVQCGKKPSKTIGDCQPKTKPCLFNILEDPCEFHNLADDNPEMVAALLVKVQQYSATAVKPVNKPSDPRANPADHGGVWVPWLDGVPMEQGQKPNDNNKNVKINET